MVSGLAASIRSSLESSTFDLAGHDTTSIQSIAHDAFSTPFPPLEQMIRITFVVGAGKLSRQKYDAKAMQILTSALRELDYVEDRGAGCSLDSAGCFKTQHDTGKNLFTVVVFPKYSGGGGGHGNKASGDAANGEEPLLPSNSPGYKIAVCSMSTFQTLLSSQCPTYAQKRKCMECIEGLMELLQSIEDKLMGGHPLDSAEQSLYDEVGELTEKLAHTQKEAAKHVDEGLLTVQEKEMLVEMNQTRIATLMKEKNSAAVAEKLKKALARKEYLQSLSDEKLSSSSTYPPPLRHEAKITPLRKKLLPLQALEGKAKGGFLTIAETKALTEKEEIESEIEQLEEASYGWFEEEDAFEERLQKSRDKFNAKFGKKSGGGGEASAKKTSAAAGKTGGRGNSVNKWILPGQKQQQGSSSAWGTSVGKKKGGKGGAVFSAMMMDDSSSDEDEESSNDEKAAPPSPVRTAVVAKTNRVEKVHSSHPGSSNFIKVTGGQSSSKSNNASSGNNINNKPSQVESTAAAPKSKSKNKSKKKKKHSKQAQSNDDVEEENQNEEDNESRGKDTTPGNKAVDEATISNSLIMFWQSFLRPFLMFIISLLVSLVSGLFGGKDSKKGSKKKRR
jgi:hypothetical protein